MSRLQPIEKDCLQCNKTFLAKRSDAKFCGNVCRAQHSDIQKITPMIIQAAKPAIIAEARKEFVDEFKGYDTCEHCNEYKPVTDCLSKHFPLPIKLCTSCNTYEILDSMGRYRAKDFIDADVDRVKNGGETFKEMMKHWETPEYSAHIKKIWKL